MYFAACFTISFNGSPLLNLGDMVPALPTLGLVLKGEDVHYIRAAYAVPLNRGGQVNTVSFTRVKELSSQAAAVSHMIGFQSAVPKAGTLIMSSGSYTNARLVSAEIKQSPQHGWWMEETYTIAYGED